ncbi:MAG TPA: hypothetical protein VJ904_11890 [Tichowtungia sp.]|nr:hypothetical protein [Tichowtungia sp.]
MKPSPQLTPAFAAAVFCALLWFALWLIPFRPATPQTARTAVPRPAGILPGAADRTPEVRSPVLFALPAEKGFSGTFPQAHINGLISPGETNTIRPLPDPGLTEHPAGRPRYLPRTPVERKVPDQVALQEAIPEIKQDLPAPGTRSTFSVPQPERIALFLSPELQKRTDKPLTLDLPGTLPPSVRIHLGIRPDGTVDQVLFDQPVENKALAGAIRKLRFTPAAGRTDSWLDLRFTPGGSS